MKFEKISIRNFRNFENIEIAISNKNIFFGLNDIGKTNFLYAMRFNQEFPELIITNRHRNTSCQSMH